MKRAAGTGQNAARHRRVGRRIWGCPADRFSYRSRGCSAPSCGSPGTHEKS